MTADLVAEWEMPMMAKKRSGNDNDTCVRIQITDQRLRTGGYRTAGAGAEGCSLRHLLLWGVPLGHPHGTQRVGTVTLSPGGRA